MRDERTGDSKSLSTGITDVGFLSRVTSDVICECACLSKALSTTVTNIWLLPTVLPGETKTEKQTTGIEHWETEDMDKRSRKNSTCIMS